MELSGICNVPAEPASHGPSLPCPMSAFQGNFGREKIKTSHLYDQNGIFFTWRKFPDLIRIRIHLIDGAEIRFHSVLLWQSVKIKSQFTILSLTRWFADRYECHQLNSRLVQIYVKTIGPISIFLLYAKWKLSHNILKGNIFCVSHK